VGIFNLKREGEVMDKLSASAGVAVVAAGIDTAKSTFSVCGLDTAHHVVLERTMNRAKLIELFARLVPCTVGIEACSGSHQLARELTRLGHTVRIIAAKFVAPHRTAGKNDRNDARAIVDALVHPRTRFVPVKSEEQQALLSLQRARAGFVAERTALGNRIRGLLAEFGVTLPVGIGKVRHGALAAAQRLPLLARQVIEELHAHLRVLDQRIGQYDRQLRELARQSEAASRLMEVLGIGPVTALTTVAMVGNGHEFKNGRQFTAWMGIVPRQYSTGGKPRLGHITRHGDVYLRALFVQAAKALLAVAHKHKDRLSQWALAVRARRGYGKAAVAVAAKLARIAWAILAKGERFRLQALTPVVSE
jgi:transposase